MNEANERIYPDWGTVLDIPIKGIEFRGVGNENKVRKFERFDPKTRSRRTVRIVGKTEEAERFVRIIREKTFEAIRELQARDPRIAEISFPIDGSKCPLRTDFYFLFDASNPDRIASLDWDNIVKGTLDGIRNGPITPTFSWGLISNDNWSTGGLVMKCLGPPGEGDILVVRAVRDGWRTLEGFALLRRSIGAFPPYRAEDKYKVATPGGWRSAGLLDSGGKPV